jgi:hypothetical protein
MADVSKAVQALTETKPPATDRFTYLTLVEEYISPEVLPSLNKILQDAELTQEIGWDLVEILIPLEGCEECLETVARLGNPREVILKVLEVVEALHDEADDEEPEEKTVHNFITLLGMLAILHRRIKTKYPSRFVGTSLRTVLGAYKPTQEMTASVINLVHSLSGQKRPPLPSRKSSVNVANPDKDGDASKNAPDPEAETEDPTEGEILRKLLLSFVTCILESYINANDMEWSPRLWEYFHPEKMVPGKKTTLESFKEDKDLLARDTIVGQLMVGPQASTAHQKCFLTLLQALTRDLGLAECTKDFVESLSKAPIRVDPLAEAEDISSASDVPLSTGGSICALAYWLFSSSVFKADQPQPDMWIFPSHLEMLELYLSDDSQAQISSTPGTVDALVAIGLWLDRDKRISEGQANFMAYHHVLTICAAFHPSLGVRNASNAIAGSILHADPDEDDRLNILEDLLENCMFASLKASAVTWLREEILNARRVDAGVGPFATSEAVERLQYLIFPDMASFREMGEEELLEWWLQNGLFVLQVANFAYFLLATDHFQAVVPSGMHAAVEQRYVEPLLQVASKLQAVNIGGVEHVALDMAVLQDRLKSLSLS